MHKVSVTDYTFPDLSIEEKIVSAAGGQLSGFQARSIPEAIACTADADAIITQFAPVNAEVIAAMKKAKVIVRYGIGVDNVDLAAAKARGIPVCNIPDYCVNEVADHTLAFVLALTRQVVANALTVRNGEWRLGVSSVMGALHDMTVGVVAFGRIGREVVKRLLAFGCEVLVFDAFCSAEVIAQAGAKPATFDELLEQSDVITLHCPSTPQTRGFIDKKRFEQMKRGVLLVNASRGDLIVTEDLIAALRSGRVGSAALDVTHPEPPPVDSALRSFPQVVIHSHIASAGALSVPRLRRSAAEHVARALRGEKPINVVNG